MGCFQMRSSVVVVVTMLLLLACCEASASSSLQQLQRHMRKILNASATSPSRCSKLEELVMVYQSPSGSLGTGMPAYSVEITNTNTCIKCAVCNVHLSCGNFANTELVDPTIFRRLAIDDCLVKDGGPIGPGETVPFHYYNSFPYPMKVASASCC